MSFHVALAQINVTVGALVPNAEKIVRVARKAREQGARIVVFPELCLCGYPPEDLILKPHFIDDCETEAASLAGKLPPDILALVGAPWRDGAHVFNAAHVYLGGARAAVVPKILLPNYGVFDEKRVFAAGERPVVLDLVAAGERRAQRIAVHICEDSWIPDGAAARPLTGLGLAAVLNLSASPYHRGKAALREAALRGTARALGAPVFYANLIGGQDELVFDGASMALDAEGRLIARARSFAEDLLLIALPETHAPPPPAGNAARAVVLPLPPGPAALPESAPRREPLPEHPADVYAALELGLRDYVDKNGFRQVVVALSGGIDSALVAAVAADALGPDRVVGVTMPSRYSSDATHADAGELARRLGIRFLDLSIEGVFEACLRDLRPVFGDRPADLTEENLQARIRGVLIMALSNKFGWLVLSTGNKSEVATGYCTLYGDMCGGFSLIKDVPKMLVFELARWRNARGPSPVIPPSTIARPPSAELRLDQRDSDSLPPYEVLDPILERYVEQDRGLDAIVAEGFDPAVVRRVIRLVDGSEYKRRQGAPGVKITPKAFGRDRRMPITHLYRERL